MLLDVGTKDGWVDGDVDGEAQWEVPLGKSSAKEADRGQMSKRGRSRNHRENYKKTLSFFSFVTRM